MRTTSTIKNLEFSFGVEVARYDAKNALLPTLEIKIRSRVNETVRVYASMAICDIYFGEGFDFRNMPFVKSVPVIINQWVSGQNWYDFTFDLTFSQEMLYKLDKLIGSGQNANFAIQTRLQYFIQGQQVSSIGEPRFEVGNCVLEVKMSDWARIAYDWGKEMVLVSMSPKMHERIREVMANSRYLRSVDEVFAELLNRYAKEELER